MERRQSEPTGSQGRPSCPGDISPHISPHLPGETQLPGRYISAYLPTSPRGDPAAWEIYLRISPHISQGRPSGLGAAQRRRLGLPERAAWRDRGATPNGATYPSREWRASRTRRSLTDGEEAGLLSCSANKTALPTCRSASGSGAWRAHAQPGTNKGETRHLSVE